MSGTSANNLPIGADLQLGPLANNGGPTLTMLPAATSPLINAGNNFLVGGPVPFDQRGPIFFRLQGALVDIGSVERQPGAPTVILSQFAFIPSPNLLSFTFDQDVSASLSSDDLQVQRIGDGDLSGIIYNGYNASTNTGQFALPASLPDGNYRACFLPNSVMGTSNNVMTSQCVLDFFVLSGDANHDRTINALDFNLLATNFGGSAKTFAQGDFNYDTTVNSTDFNVLATRFNTTLDAPASESLLAIPLSASRPAAILFSDTAIHPQPTDDPPDNLP
jgi:hypothetical protein